MARITDLPNEVLRMIVSYCELGSIDYFLTNDPTNTSSIVAAPGEWCNVNIVGSPKKWCNIDIIIGIIKIDGSFHEARDAYKAKMKSDDVDLTLFNILNTCKLLRAIVVEVVLAGKAAVEKPIDTTTKKEKKTRYSTRLRALALTDENKFRTLFRLRTRMVKVQKGLLEIEERSKNYKRRPNVRTRRCCGCRPRPSRPLGIPNAS